MSNQNFYIKQTSCLQQPAHNRSWHDILQKYPGISLLLTETGAKSQSKATAVDSTAIKAGKANQRHPIGQSIPWCTSNLKQKDEEEKQQFQLKRFIYDCSYLSPFVSNLYTRERSAKGWYRWVGPNPGLEVRLPMAQDQCEHWLFTATFHAFLDESHANNITFDVNDKQKQLDWIEGSTYQSRITASELYGNARPCELAVVSITIALPEARKASEQDQRIIAFAIRGLSLTPA